MAIKRVKENGKFKYEVIVKIRDKSGKQVMRRRRWFRSEREAKKVEFELMTELEGHKSKITWDSWVETFLDKHKFVYRASTVFNYQHNLNKWFNPVLDGKFLADIKPSDIHQIIHENAEGVSSYTKRGLIKIVKRVFNSAIEEGLINHNPAVGIRVKCADSNQLVLNRNEVHILLREAKKVDHRFFPHWSLALLTGMRSGELYSLRWTDIDFVNKQIKINKAWTRHNGEGPTKSAKNRLCPMSKECQNFLSELKLLNGSNSEFVLPRLWEWDQGDQAKVLKSFCKEIGITPIKFHDLRATFITQMLNNGVPLSKVMAIVGHSSLKTTQGYLRLSGKDIEGATEDLKIEVPSLTSNDSQVIKLFREQD